MLAVSASHAILPPPPSVSCLLCCIVISLLPCVALCIGYDVHLFPAPSVHTFPLSFPLYISLIFRISLYLPHYISFALSRDVCPFVCASVFVSFSSISPPCTAPLPRSIISLSLSLSLSLSIYIYIYIYRTLSISFTCIYIYIYMYYIYIDVCVSVGPPPIHRCRKRTKATTGSLPPPSVPSGLTSVAPPLGPAGLPETTQPTRAPSPAPKPIPGPDSVGLSDSPAFPLDWASAATLSSTPPGSPTPTTKRQRPWTDSGDGHSMKRIGRQPGLAQTGLAVPVGKQPGPPVLAPGLDAQAPSFGDQYSLLHNKICCLCCGVWRGKRGYGPDEWTIACSSRLRVVCTICRKTDEGRRHHSMLSGVIALPDAEVRPDAKVPPEAEAPPEAKARPAVPPDGAAKPDAGGKPAPVLLAHGIPAVRGSVGRMLKQ